MSRKQQRKPLPRKRTAPKKPKAPPVPKVRGLEVPDGLTAAMFVFCLTYRANGFNASAAYREAHPDCKETTARTEGHRTLAHPNVAAWLEKHVGDRWKRWQMDGEEAVARIAMDARADIRDAFPGKGIRLEPHEWPDEFANSVKSYDPATGRITLNDSAAARRVIGEHSGKLKGAGAGLMSLAEILAAKLQDDDE